MNELEFDLFRNAGPDLFKKGFNGSTKIISAIKLYLDSNRVRCFISVIQDPSKSPYCNEWYADNGDTMEEALTLAIKKLEESL